VKEEVSARGATVEPVVVAEPLELSCLEGWKPYQIGNGFAGLGFWPGSPLHHGQKPWSTEVMETMPISKFKATCLAALERVRRTGKPLRVTRFGKPMADILPPAREKSKQRQLGAMEGRGAIVGDIISPIDVVWEAMAK
jgi:antitoxin (DNA-binding transcriptional repressor) of toxin-antitoxin stability system